MSNLSSRLVNIPKLPEEVWEVCCDKNFDQYAVSNKGRVWDLLEMKERTIYEPKEGLNCPLVSLYKSDIGKYRMISVNRLVANQFNKDVTLAYGKKLVFVYKKNNGTVGNSEASAVSFSNRFSEQEVHGICKEIVKGVSLTKIAKAHGTYRNRISFIALNRSYREISKFYW